MALEERLITEATFFVNKNITESIDTDISLLNFDNLNMLLDCMDILLVSPWFDPDETNYHENNYFIGISTNTNDLFNHLIFDKFFGYDGTVNAVIVKYYTRSKDVFDKLLKYYNEHNLK